MRTPRLAADDLVLKAPDVGNADDWSDTQGDEYARWLGWPCRPDAERCRAYLGQVANDTESGPFTRATRTLTRSAGGADLKLHEGRWSTFYFVHPTHRGRGITTCMFRLMCAQAFDDLGPDVAST